MQPDDLKDFDDLDNLVGGALERLPPPRAPRSLLPRVMAAVEANQAAQRPAPRTRPWLAWPLAWQVASVAVVMAMSIGVWRLWPHTVSLVAWFTPPSVAEVSTELTSVGNTAAAVVGAARTVWHALVQPLVFYMLALVLAMCAACAAFGAALGRVVFEGVAQS
jgi:hypothetical protein